MNLNVVLMVLVTTLGLAQTTAQPPRPEFEVASIKLGDPGSRRVGIGFRPGGDTFKATNASLQRLIGFAYDLRNHQISGGPDWLDSAKFNIDAKAGSAIPPGLAGGNVIRLMVQSLLAERFKLASHLEMREEQLYELVVNKDGPKLRESAPAAPGQPQGVRIGRGELTGTAAPIAILVNQLSQQLGRSVTDKTGLTGRYDFTLKWTPDDLGVAAGQPAGPDAPTADPSGPSIFTAVQEDLGLKLQSAKGQVEILVIDHAERPDAN